MLRAVQVERDLLDVESNSEGDSDNEDAAAAQFWVNPLFACCFTRESWASSREHRVASMKKLLIEMGCCSSEIGRLNVILLQEQPQPMDVSFWLFHEQHRAEIPREISVRGVWGYCVRWAEFSLCSDP